MKLPLGQRPGNVRSVRVSSGLTHLINGALILNLDLIHYLLNVCQTQLGSRSGLGFLLHGPDHFHFRYSSSTNYMGRLILLSRLIGLCPKCFLLHNHRHAVVWLESFKGEICLSCLICSGSARRMVGQRDQPAAYDKILY